MSTYDAFSTDGETSSDRLFDDSHRNVDAAAPGAEKTVVNPSYSSFQSQNSSDAPYDDVFNSSDQMHLHDEGFALCEWRRQNAIRLEEKEKSEKELRMQIIEEAEEYKRAFLEKKIQNIVTKQMNNRDKENMYLVNQEKFHKEADKQYWKAIAELIPHEVPTIEKRGKKKEDKDQKASITIIQGPKPGKPTDMSRMRQVLVKLKHTPPPHMTPPKPELSKNIKDSKEGKDVVKESPPVAA
ncbi:clathrin light chain 1-like [Silene latifolia]|uniref:clathrin light chain 1-like n=1 Tax=Silene latifolia TaxID=37657 RepID=UPI003D7841BA